MDVDHDLEEMMGKLGDFGRYQMAQFSLHILAGLTAGLHMLTLVTVAAIPEHRCMIPGVDINGTAAPWNSSLVRAAIPYTEENGLDSCYMYDAHNQTVACTEYVFDNKYYQSSRAIEWNMVCSRRWMGAIAQMTYMFGVFTGAVTLGGLADRIGRKAVFCWSALLQLVLGVGVAFVPEYISFLVVRFLYGVFGSAGSYITGFVLTMELVGASKRTVCGIAFQAAFAGGVMLVAAWGALIHDRQILQVVYGLHGALLIVHWWLMDESPRWLWMQGRAREAVLIVQRALEMNKRGLSLDVSYYVSKGKVVSHDDGPSAGVSDLFKTPNLRKKTLNVCLCWFANSLVYYGLSLSAGKLYGNPFLILFIMGLVEFPNYIATVFLMDRLGRRSLISGFMIAGGICCIVAAYIEQGSTAATSIVMLGKLFIAGSFAIIYIYSAELFPTVVRNSALGLGSMCARLSGALTPLITLLDSFDPTIPAVIFGVISLVSGLLCLILPETTGQPMPQSLNDGERFGVGDTCFTTCLGKNKTEPEPEPQAEQMYPMNTVVS
uniref:Putative synaptic vesicle transporter sv2 major facilitator superfamily n=1 Tax=Xenopsylla cheopis TaxID=163159 RepID=A0A6M2DLM1_XENCH